MSETSSTRSLKGWKAKLHEQACRAGKGSGKVGRYDWRKQTIRQ